MILVTGANGLLGSFICDVLHRADMSFKAMVRKTSDLRLLKNIPSKLIVEGDLFDVLHLESILQGITTVIHCAGFVSYNEKDKKALFQTNVEGTKNIVNACLSTNTQNFIHVSSIAAIGRNKKNAVVRETTKWENSHLNTEYAKSKYLGELEVWRAGSEGLNVKIINPSVILAPYGWERSSTKLFDLVNQEFPFYPSGNLNYVDIRDVGEIVMKLLDDGIAGERFIVNAGSVSYKELFQRVASKFNKRAPGIRLSLPLAWMGWMFENIRSTIAGRETLVTKETTRLSFTKSRYDNYKSNKILNHKYRSLENTLNWICGNYNEIEDFISEPDFQT